MYCKLVRNKEKLNTRNKMNTFITRSTIQCSHLFKHHDRTLTGFLTFVIHLNIGAKHVWKYGLFVYGLHVWMSGETTQTSDDFLTQQHSWRCVQIERDANFRQPKCTQCRWRDTSWCKWMLTDANWELSLVYDTALRETGSARTELGENQETVGVTVTFWNE